MSVVFEQDDIANLCASTPVSADHSTLLQKIARVYPDLNFSHVLTRGGWHRVGGLLNKQGERIAAHLPDWIEQVSGGDLDEIIEQYSDCEYQVTLFQGQTHYFVASTGDDAQHFVQLEIETLQEIVYRTLFDADHMPDDIADLIEPLNAHKLDPRPVGDSVYDFRRMNAIDEYIEGMQKRDAEMENSTSRKILRFMSDWDRSSAREAGPFCQHWVLSLQEYTDAWGESIKQARPISTYDGDFSQLRLDANQGGSEMAKLIHGFDHGVGYSMAWYFFMLSRPEVPYQLADAIHQDLTGSYAYLPSRDLKIIQDWIVKPYGV